MENLLVNNKNMVETKPILYEPAFSKTLKFVKKAATEHPTVDFSRTKMTFLDDFGYLKVTYCKLINSS